MPSINQWGRENPDKIDTPDDAQFVAPNDTEAVAEAGYWGRKADTSDRHQFTVAGVTEQNRSTRLTGPGVEAQGGLDVKPERRTRSRHEADES